MPKVSILVPTMNRSDFVIRLLEYYNSVGSSHPIYIGDASNDKHKKRILNKVSDLKGRIHVNYFYWPKYNDLRTLKELVKRSKEKYCAYIGDDDFLIPDSLEKCANFLKKNPKYRTAQGKALLFHFDDSKPYGRNIFSSQYWDTISLEQEKSSQRFLEFGNNYWTPVFSVKRRNEFIKDLEFYGSMPDKNFGELISNFTFIARGKSKFLDCLYLIRQGHNNRYVMKSGTSWIKAPFWNKSLQIFVKSLSSIISQEDKISYEKANLIVNKVVDEIIILSFKKEINRINFSQKNFYRRSVDYLKKNYTITRYLIFTFKYLHSIVNPYKFELSEISILNKSSKYYHEFKPIFNILNQKK